MINTYSKNRFTKIFWKKMLKIDFLYELCPFIAKIHKLSLIHTKSIFGYVSLIYFVLNGIFNVFCSLSVIENIQIKRYALFDVASGSKTGYLSGISIVLKHLSYQRGPYDHSFHSSQLVEQNLKCNLCSQFNILATSADEPILG